MRIVLGPRAGATVKAGPLGVLIAGAVMTAAAPAQAHNGSNDSKIVASFSRLEVALDGRIPGRCEMGSGGDINFGELTGNETATADVPFQCNVPFEIGLQSVHGGLAHQTLPDGQGPFAGTLGYSVSVRVPTRAPQPGAIAETYQSGQLTARKTLSSQGAIAAGGARLRFQTDPLIGPGLLAGEYSETLYLTVTPKF